MAVTTTTAGNNALAADVDQFRQLLLGIMTDQPVYVANTIRSSTTGATAFAAFAGGTVTGAPTTGTHAVGEFIVDQTQPGFLVCTVAGTPGTWVGVGRDRSYLAGVL